MRKRTKNLDEATVDGNSLATILDAVNGVSGYKIQNRFTGDMPAVISTGNYALDHMLGIGGIPLGQMVQVYGEASQGKTLFALHMVHRAQLQFPDKIPVYIDSEGSYTHTRAKQHGVDTDRLILIQGNTAEEKFAQALAALQTGKVSLMVFDSWGALEESCITDHPSELFKRDKDGNVKNMGTVAGMARLTTKFLKACGNLLLEHKPAFLIVDQNRSKIGTFYGDPTTRTGGKYKGFAIVIEMRVRAVEAIKSDPLGDPDGLKVAFTVKKNKYAPIRETTDKNHPIFWFSDEAREMGAVQDLLDRLLRNDIVVQEGAWYRWMDGDEVKCKWQGKVNCIYALRDDKGLQEVLTQIVGRKEKLIGDGGGLPQESVAESKVSEVSSEQEVE